jgi:hypothetical protein
LSSALLSGWRRRMFPFHTLVFAFRSVMLDKVSSPVIVHPRMRHLRFGGGLVGLGRFSNGCACALLWFILEPILHRFYETHQVGLGWLHEQNCDLHVDVAPLHQ